MPEQPKSGKLRIKQYQKYLDSDNRFEITLKIVQSKVEHSLNLLDELSKFYESVDFAKIRKSAEKEDLFLLDIMKNSKNQDISKSIKQLMTYEERIAGIYHDNLTAIFNQLYPEFNFTGRKNNSNSRNYNASDEIKALLNYDYAILESEIRKAINSVGLDYSIGFLHEITQSITPLVYDIQELFRWLIDISAIQLLEEKKIKKSISDNIEENKTDNRMEMTKNAELFAKGKHAGMTKKDNTTTHSQHLQDVVNRLKGLGVIDQDIICAGWLHDTIEDTETSFEELLEKFGNKVAVSVLSLSKDKSLPKKPREKAYIRQIKEASVDSKIIKLCDVSANLSSLKNTNYSDSKKRRIGKQIRQYVIAIKSDLVKNEDYPKIITLLESANQNLKQMGQKAIPLQSKT